MMRTLRGGRFGFDFIGRSRTWLIISAVALVLGAGSLAIRGFNLGLEFRGGTAIQLEAEQDADVEEMKAALAAVDIPDPVVQRVGQRGFLIQTLHLGPELHEAAVAQVARVAGIDPSEVNVTDVGPRWGRQISSKALQALLVFLVIASAYIALRFDPKMAAVAIVALFHDLLLTAGIYSLTGFVVTPATVIAILTILGYSLYDTVVIFDRVKEKTSALSVSGRQTYSDVANESLNAVLVRSLNTSMTSLLPVGSLLFVGSFLLGAQTLRELALALFVGIAVGTYSSIFVATPLLVMWKEREPKYAALRARIASRAAEPSGARTSGPATEKVTAAAGPGSRPRPPQQRRRRRKRRR